MAYPSTRINSISTIQVHDGNQAHTMYMIKRRKLKKNDIIKLNGNRFFLVRHIEYPTADAEVIGIIGYYTDEE